MKSNCIICDLDGVFFDSREWLKYLPQGSEKREDWDNFANHVDLCKPNKPFIKTLSEVNKVIPTIFVTGRENTPFLFQKTKKQILRASNLSFTPNINCKLIMRRMNDYRNAADVKEEVVKKLLLSYNPIIAIDDEPANIEIYQKYKIPTLHYTKYRDTNDTRKKKN